MDYSICYSCWILHSMHLESQKFDNSLNEIGILMIELVFFLVYWQLIYALICGYYENVSKMKDVSLVVK